MADLLKSKAVDCTLTNCVIHVGDSKHAYTHVEYWQEIFRANKVPILFLVRSLNVFKKLKKLNPQLSICCAESAIDIEKLVCNLKRLKVVFYTGNTGNNIHILRFNKYKHIYIGSEHSERLSKLTKYRKVYDSIWISGSQEEQKYKDSNLGLFDMHRVGKPALLPFIKQRSSIRNVKKENVLYLIDSQSKATSSMHLAGDIIRLLDDHYISLSVLAKEDFKKNVKLHSCFECLCNGLRNTLKTSQYEKLSPQLSYNHCIIADISLFSLELLVLGRPIILYYDKNTNHLSNEDMEYYSGFDFCYKFESVFELDIILKNLKAEDVLKELREVRMDALMGLTETLENHFLVQLKMNELTH